MANNLRYHSRSISLTVGEIKILRDATTFYAGELTRMGNLDQFEAQSMQRKLAAVSGVSLWVTVGTKTQNELIDTYDRDQSDE